MTHTVIILITTNSMGEKTLPEKLKVAQPIKELPAIYRTKMFIALFTREQLINLVHNLISYFLNFHFNITLRGD